MKKVRVSLGQNSYNIHIGADLLTQTGRFLKELGFTDKAVIVTDTTVKNLYALNLKQSLTGNGFITTILGIPEGEDNKSLANAERLYGELVKFGAERSTPVLALGGGVIGDLAGFVAATYMRGIPLVQLPTTLLAQVDSSIGGKVAVNHGNLKNIVGAFYQPRIVISDITTLQTLPPTEITNGLGEVIKYAIIRDAEFFNYLEENLDKIESLDNKVLENIVTVSARIKAEIVEKDEKDLGLRNILNFGHTIGHAVESVSDFKIPHGHAVSIGMLSASNIAVQLGKLDNTHAMRIRKLLKRSGLTTKIPKIEINKIIEFMAHDKKVINGKIRFVLPRAVGDVFVTDELDMEIIKKNLVSMR
jgi:3-dehydroquinate synthase